MVVNPPEEVFGAMSGDKGVMEDVVDVVVVDTEGREEVVVAPRKVLVAREDTGPRIEDVKCAEELSLESAPIVPEIENIPTVESVPDVDVAAG